MSQLYCTRPFQIFFHNATLGAVQSLLEIFYFYNSNSVLFHNVRHSDSLPFSTQSLCLIRDTLPHGPGFKNSKRSKMTGDQIVILIQMSTQSNPTAARMTHLVFRRSRRDEWIPKSFYYPTSRTEIPLLTFMLYVSRSFSLLFSRAP